MTYALMIILSHKKTSHTSIVFTMVAQKLEHRITDFNPGVSRKSLKRMNESIRDTQYRP